MAFAVSLFPSAATPPLLVAAQRNTTVSLMVTSGVSQASPIYLQPKQTRVRVVARRKASVSCNHSAAQKIAPIFALASRCHVVALPMPASAHAAIDACGRHGERHALALSLVLHSAAARRQSQIGRTTAQLRWALTRAHHQDPQFHKGRVRVRRLLGYGCISAL